MKAMVLVFVKA